MALISSYREAEVGLETGKFQVSPVRALLGLYLDRRGPGALVALSLLTVKVGTFSCVRVLVKDEQQLASRGQRFPHQEGKDKWLPGLHQTAKASAR